MATQITSKSQLKKIMDNACKMACLAVQKKFYQVLNLFIEQYYNEWQPAEYHRTEKFLHSAFKSKIVKVSDGYECRVYIDTDSMNSYVEATGYQVTDWANSGLHGGWDVRTNTHVWDNTVDNTITNGELVSLAKAFLISYGFDVR